MCQNQYKGGKCLSRQHSLGHVASAGNCDHADIVQQDKQRLLCSLRPSCSRVQYTWDSTGAVSSWIFKAGIIGFLILLRASDPCRTAQALAQLRSVKPCSFSAHLSLGGLPGLVVFQQLLVSNQGHLYEAGRINIQPSHQNPGDQFTFQARQASSSFLDTVHMTDSRAQLASMQCIAVMMILL